MAKYGHRQFGVSVELRNYLPLFIFRNGLSIVDKRKKQIFVSPYIGYCAHSVGLAEITHL